MLFLPHNKNRPNYHPAVGQLCGSHHVTQTDETTIVLTARGEKNNKTKHAYFYDWEGTARGETDGTHNFSKHIVVSYSKIQQMLLKVRERERERALRMKVLRFLEDVCFRKPHKWSRRTNGEPQATRRNLHFEDVKTTRWEKTSRGSYHNEPGVKFGIFCFGFSERDDFVVFFPLHAVVFLPAGVPSITMQNFHAEPQIT